MARTATGIDVGTHTAIAIRGQYKGNTFHATGFAVAQNDGDEPADAYRALAPELKASGFKPTAARIAVSGRDVNVRYTRVPEVPDWQLRNLMRFEVQEIGDQSGSEVASDFNLLPRPPEISGEDVVLLAMARESLLEQHQAGLASVGGTLDSFSPAALGLYNAFLRYGVVQDETVLLANVGAENVDVVITRGPDLLFARNLTGGGRLFDDAVAQRFGVDPARGEELKIELASLKPGKPQPTPNHDKASRAILGAAGQLASLLQSAVMFCKSQVKISGLKIDRVLLCGGGAALDGLVEYLRAGMGVPIELFDPFRVVDTSALAPEVADQLEEYKLEAVVALGLATMGSDPDAYGIEVLPAKLAKQREFLGGTIWLIGAGLLLVGLLGFQTKRLMDRLDVLTGEGQRFKTRYERERRVHDETEGLIAQNEELIGLVTRLNGVVGQGEQLARTFEVLDQHLPADFWLTEIDSGWDVDPELGLARGMEAPVLQLRGRAREGVQSPASQHQRMVLALREGLPGVAVNDSIDRNDFHVDLTCFAPPSPDAGDTAEGAAERGATTPVQRRQGGGSR
ncbi:MAG: pilus assembly protein PilM [Planctomycetota bacterium]